MRPSEIRTELLAQHAQIRGLMAAVRRLAEQARRGEAMGAALQTGVSLLAVAFQEHNAREEELLRPILPTVDAWGAARAEIMNESHVHEHDSLRDAIAGIPRTPREFAGAGVVELFARIAEHMEREEQTILADDVLKDDTVVVDVGG